MSARDTVTALAEPTWSSTCGSRLDDAAHEAFGCWKIKGEGTVPHWLRELYDAYPPRVAL
jgi:hypothetical protein